MSLRNRIRPFLVSTVCAEIVGSKEMVNGIGSWIWKRFGRLVDGGFVAVDEHRGDEHHGDGDHADFGVLDRRNRTIQYGNHQTMTGQVLKVEVV